MIFGLDLRAARRGGAVVPARLMPLPGEPPRPLAALQGARRIVFLVHGFNVDRPSGQVRLRDFARSFARQGAAALVAVTWPGDSWAGFASYPLEGKDADDSARELARFIVTEIPDGTELAFAAHSLGTRVVLETLRRLRGRGYAIGEVCVMAAAVDDTSLANARGYREAVRTARRLTVLASTGDIVLGMAYPVGDLLQAFLFRRDEPGRALGYRGPRPHRGEPVPPNTLHTQIADGVAPDGRPWRVGHGDYLPASPPTAAQTSAATYADAALAGVERPQYPY